MIASGQQKAWIIKWLVEVFLQPGCQPLATDKEGRGGGCPTFRATYHHTAGTQLVGEPAAGDGRPPAQAQTAPSWGTPQLTKTRVLLSQGTCWVHQSQLYNQITLQFYKTPPSESVNPPGTALTGVRRGSQT